MISRLAIGIASGTLNRYTSVRRVAQKTSDINPFWRWRSSPFLGTIIMSQPLGVRREARTPKGQH
jgi:hypothetical protein